MKRRQFIQGATVMTAGMMVGMLPTEVAALPKKSAAVRLLRHATIAVQMGAKVILVDPMLSKREALDPVANASNTQRIPMVDLPISDEELTSLLQRVEAVIITHLHRDHWDIAAQKIIQKDVQVFCQTGDEQKITQQGFRNVQPISDSYKWGDLELHRTNGRHGTGDVAKRMGNVSGFVISFKKKKLYIAGDTIWCEEVEAAIEKHKPTHIIVNGGGAQFIEGDPITMTVADVIKLTQSTTSPVTVVHLDTINHCYQHRSDFRKAVKENSLQKQVNIPEDGESIDL